MAEAMVALRDVHVSRDGRPVLAGLSLRLGASERLAITGANGAGKTTLLHSIIGLEPVQAGEVVLFSQPCRRERDFQRLRTRLGFLFQDSDDQLFCPTVIEDVAFGPLNTGCDTATARARALQALQGLGIRDLAGRLVHRLSGGEKRLVCLAGLLAMHPDALLLDEPTNGLDAAHRARLGAALAGFTGAILLVSHDTGFVAETCTRRLELHQGRLRDPA